MASLTMYRGDTLILDCAVTAAGGGAQDLTGCTLTMTAKRSKNDADSAAVFQLTSPSGGIVIDSPASLGTGVITVSPSDTADLTRDTKLVYDVQIEDGSGNIYTSETGTLNVTLDVTTGG
jgi:hypothetical protein